MEGSSTCIPFLRKFKHGNQWCFPLCFTPLLCINCLKARPLCSALSTLLFLLFFQLFFFNSSFPWANSSFALCSKVSSMNICTILVTLLCTKPNPLQCDSLLECVLISCKSFPIPHPRKRGIIRFPMMLSKYKIPQLRCVTHAGGWDIHAQHTEISILLWSGSWM